MLSSFPLLLPFTLAWRNMRTRLWRTTLTLIGIVLGVAVVLAIQITNDSTLASLRQVFDQAAGQANLLVVAQNSQASGATTQVSMNADLLGQVEKQREVQVASPVIHARSMLARDANRYQFDFTITGVSSASILQVYGIDPALDPQVRVYALESGRLPDPGKYEAAVPESYADDKGLDTGNDLVIITPQGEAHLKIVGMLRKEGVALMNDGSIAFVPLEVVQDLFDRRDELDEIALKVDPVIADNPRSLAALKESLQASLEDGADVIYPSARGEMVPVMLNTYQQGLQFFSIIAVFVGGFLIYNTFSMTVVERTREIGMLRAIGMNRLHILRMVLAEAGILSLIGSGLGILGGLLLSRGLIRLMSGVAAGTEGAAAVRIPLMGLLLSLLVGMGVTLSAALIPALQASRTSPLEALRARGRSGQSVSRKVWIAGTVLLLAGWLAIYRVPWRPEVLFGVGSLAILFILLGATLTVPLVVTVLERVTRPLSTLIYRNEGRIGSSNVHRSVGRTTLTVAALMVALTMVIGIGSLAYTLEHDITQWIDSALGGDLYIRSAIPMRESFARQLEQVPGVQAVTPARYIAVKPAHAQLASLDEREDTITFNAIDPFSYRQVGSVEFTSGQGDPEAIWQRFEQGGALFISSAVADRYNIQQGESLLLETRRGEHAFYVAGEIVDFAGGGLTVIGSYDDLHRYFAEQGADRFTVDVASGYNVEAVAAEIENRYEARRNITAQTTELFKTKINSLMDRAFRLFDVLNLIGIIIGALGVINTLTMNVIERQQEIGGLRSLGMTRRQVLRMVLAESLAMGLSGGLYGLAFGWVISQILILGMNLLNGYDLRFLFTPWPFVTGMLIAFLVSQVAALIPARGAARVNIVEAIKHE
jgi:putative ABC transport system permease protein